jgi:hypothetical protein
MQQQTFQESQIRLALGNWLFKYMIVGHDGQTPNVDSFFQVLNQVSAPLQKNMNSVNADNLASDPADDEANVCTSCQ